MAAPALTRRHVGVLLAAFVIIALSGPLAAQGIEESGAQVNEPQSTGQQGGKTNQYGWPADYTAQVGAGVTNAITTGYSGPDESQSGSAEISLPPLPSADLCSDWEGTEAHRHCMEKVVQP